MSRCLLIFRCTPLHNPQTDFVARFLNVDFQVPAPPQTIEALWYDCSSMIIAIEEFASQVFFIEIYFHCEDWVLDRACVWVPVLLTDHIFWGIPSNLSLAYRGIKLILVVLYLVLESCTVSCLWFGCFDLLKVKALKQINAYLCIDLPLLDLSNFRDVLLIEAATVFHAHV